MRLLAHNLLICNFAECESKNFPLSIEIEKSIYRETQFNYNNIKKIIKKLDWPALHKTVLQMGQDKFPENVTDEIENEDFLKKLHKIILDTHILSGKLKCPNCRRVYHIVDEIPNMILNQNQN